MDYKQDRNTERNPKDTTRTIRIGQNQKDTYDIYETLRTGHVRTRT
jgi:hypothetical protein